MSISLTTIIVFFTVLVVLYPVIRRLIKLLSFSLDKGIDSSSKASYVGAKYIDNKLATKLVDINKQAENLPKDIWKEFEKEMSKY